MVSIFAALLAALAIAAPAEDRVKTLPDVNGGKEFDFEMYSGYLDVNGTSKHLHYILAESQNDTATNPLVIWFNGGPGCSSLGGFGAENGPFVIPDGNLSFIENPNSWNKNASVLWLEFPAGVGYSYLTDPSEAYFDDHVSS